MILDDLISLEKTNKLLIKINDMDISDKDKERLLLIINDYSILYSTIAKKYEASQKWREQNIKKYNSYHKKYYNDKLKKKEEDEKEKV